MNRILIPLALGLLATCLPACTQQTGHTPGTPPGPAATESTPAPATETAAQPVNRDLAAKAGSIDMKRFPGTFGGILPCASCPGIETRLELDADGPFTLTETYQDETGAPVVTQGTWTVEDGGTRVLLDPDSKSEQDRSYGIVSNDEIRQLGLDGKPIESRLDYSLRRTSK